MKKGDTPTWAKRLTEPRTRSLIHFLVLILMGLAVVLRPDAFEISETLAEDKAKHYGGGNLIATAVFVVGYLALAVKGLLLSPRPITVRLLLLPTAFAVIGAIAFGIVTLVAAGKEGIDSTGAGTVDWYDFTVTLDGAFVPHIQALVTLIAVTPAMIPLDMFLQWPAQWFKPKGTGHQEMDTYLEEKKRHREKNARVLIVEDDIACASLALKFCKKVGLQAKHVDTIAAAQKAVASVDGKLSLILLDLFVRVENQGDRRTGAEWLADLTQFYSKAERLFAVVITTGHPEMVGEHARHADLVLEKPWSPADLLTFLKEEGIVTPP